MVPRSRANTIFVVLGVRRKRLGRIPQRADLLALARIGEPAVPGAEIVLHVLGVAGRRDDAGHSGLGEDVFEAELRSARAIEFAGPVGKGASAHAAK